MEFSDFLPHLGSCADDMLMVRSLHSEEFNHHPGQLMMQCGVSRFGMPTMGAWVTYGLGSVSENLPGYVVLTAGRGSSGGATLYQSGFLPSSYAGVLFRNPGEPVLNLRNPDGLPAELQRAGLDALRQLNNARYQEVHDPEIASRIANYELASRMQLAAPELLDLSSETQATLDMYGVGRPEPEGKDFRGSLPHLKTFDALRTQLLVGPTSGPARCAVREHHSCLVGSTQRTGQESTVQRHGRRPTDRRVDHRISSNAGCLDETLVVVGAEFGRTPLGENRPGRLANTGRDHHPFAFTMLLAGGGIKGGQVYGETDEIGWQIARDPVHINDLHATILHLFGLDHLRHTYRFQGRDFRLTDVGGKVMNEWMA